MECICSCCLVCHLYSHVCLTHSSASLCAFASHLSCNSCMMSSAVFLQGDEGPIGPPGNAGPTVRTPQLTSGVNTHTRTHWLCCSVDVWSQTACLNLLSGGTADEMRWMHHELLSLLVILPVSVPLTVFSGETRKERLYRWTWPWGFGGESYFILPYLYCHYHTVAVHYIDGRL